MSTPPPKVEYRRLGNSGLRVSVPILGTMTFGSPGWAPWVLDEEASLPILEAAWARGINTFDTANVYSNGLSEKIVGEFIKRNKIPRHEVIIATKCFNLVVDDPGVRTALHPELKALRPNVHKYGLSRGAIFNAVEASLANLSTTYIDLLQLHRIDLDVPAEEIMKALHDLVESGKVRYIGASSMRGWHFAHLQEVAAKNGWTKFVSMQNEYSLLYREDERELLQYCEFHGIGIIPWGPIGAGDLGRPHSQPVETKRTLAAKALPWHQGLTAADKIIIDRVEELSKKYQRSMAQIALAWVGSKVSSPIIGASSVERVDDAIITGFKLTEEEIKYLEEPYIPKAVRGHV